MAFGAAAAVVAHDAHAHAVAVQHRAHLLRREVDVGGAALVADHEAVAVAVALHGAVDLAHQSGAEHRSGSGEMMFLMIKFLCPEMPRWRNW